MARVNMAFDWPVCVGSQGALRGMNQAQHQSSVVKNLRKYENLQARARLWISRTLFKAC
jgi:hypothetical protein